MTNTDIQQAREWAENGAVKVNSGEVIDEIAKAAVRVIQSLPDHWIDADKVREVLDMWAGNPFPTSDEVAVLNDFEALLAPSLPTLADMTPEERKACQWMQADVSLQGETLRVAITRTVERYSSVEVIDPNGFQVSYDHELVTPLPDLPRLEWPGSGGAPTVAEHANVTPDQQVNSAQSPKSSLPRPEDVPEGEPWIVRYERKKWVGVRANADRVPWHIISMDGLDCRDVEDSEIALMPRLVPGVTP